MKDFSLRDLEFDGESYFFPGGEEPYTLDQALDILTICNYTGILTSYIEPQTVTMLIKDVEYLHSAYSNLLQLFKEHERLCGMWKKM